MKRGGSILQSIYTRPAGVDKVELERFVGCCQCERCPDLDMEVYKKYVLETLDEVTERFIGVNETEYDAQLEKRRALWRKHYHLVKARRAAANT